MTTKNPKPWVIVEKAGTDEEDTVADFKTFREAARFHDQHKNDYDGMDIMHRQDDGTLTAEY